MITIIAAAAENNALGLNNALLWHLPDDFKRFRQITTGHHIIMGRKTFESFPKPLPDRTHVIVTRQKSYHPEGCLIAGSIEEAISIAPKEETVFIIGGSEIYNLALPFADTIELTRVHESFEADAFFPEIDRTEWELISEEHHPADEKHKFGFTYQTFVRA
ncbi:MAG TPA: dihydrofolate reductase [Flavobacterium sp.]|nr:dihydrofolate reductase [Flavobacterium sp.]